MDSMILFLVYERVKHPDMPKIGVIFDQCMEMLK